MTTNGNMKNIYLYARFERLWHWLQTLLIIILLLTGFEVNGAFTLFGFGTAVEVHNFVGLTWLELGFGVTDKPRLTAMLAVCAAGLLAGNEALALAQHVIDRCGDGGEHARRLARGRVGMKAVGKKLSTTEILDSIT